MASQSSSEKAKSFVSGHKRKSMSPPADLSQPKLPITKEQVQEKLMEVNALLRPILWSDEAWENFIQGPEFWRCVPSHLLDAVKYPELLRAYRWVRFWEEWPHGGGSQQRKKLRKKWAKYQGRRNQEVRTILAVLKQRRQAADDAQTARSVAAVPSDSPCKRDGSAIAGADAAEDDNAAEICILYGDANDNGEDSDNEDADADAGAASVIVAGSSMDDPGPWFMTEDTIALVHTLTAKLLATGCSLNCLLSYKGGCAMIASITAVRQFIHSLTKQQAWVELWGWVAGYLKVTSATDLLLELLQQRYSSATDFEAAMADGKWFGALQEVMSAAKWLLLTNDPRYELELKVLSGGFLKSIKGIGAVTEKLIPWLKQQQVNQSLFLSTCHDIAQKCSSSPTDAAASAVSIFERAANKGANLPGAKTDYFAAWVARANWPQSSEELAMSDAVKKDHLPPGLSDLEPGMLAAKVQEVGGHADLVDFIGRQGSPFIKCVQCEMLKVLKWVKREAGFSVKHSCALPVGPKAKPECYITWSNVDVKDALVRVSDSLDDALKEPRVASFEWRQQRDGPTWQAAGRWSNTAPTAFLRETATSGARYPCVTSGLKPVSIDNLLAFMSESKDPSAGVGSGPSLKVS